MDTAKEQQQHAIGQAVAPEDVAVFLELARFARGWIEEERPDAARIDLPSGGVVTHDDLTDLLAKYEGSR